MHEQIYEFICNYLREHQELPARATIAQQVHATQFSVDSAVRELRAQGLIVQGSYCPTGVSDVLGYERMPTREGLYHTRKKRKAG